MSRPFKRFHGLLGNLAHYPSCKEGIIVKDPHFWFNSSSLRCASHGCDVSLSPEEITVIALMGLPIIRNSGYFLIDITEIFEELYLNV